MRNLLYVALILFAALLFSCKEKQARPAISSSEDRNIAEATKEIDAESNNINSDFELKVTSPQPIDTAQLREMLTENFSHFSIVQQRLINDLLKLDNTSVKALGSAKEVLIKYLKNATARQCDSLYVSYYKYSGLILHYTNCDEYYSQVPEGYFSVYDSFEDLPPAYKPIIAELNTYGIQLEDIGEGCADLSFYPDYFYQLFKPYTTEATRKYLELLAYERANEFLFDAAICISWEELGDRTVSLEDFVSTYPKSMFVSDIEDRYSSYTLLLLVGCSNTPTYDRYTDGSSKLDPNVYEAYQSIIDKHKDKRLAKTLKEWCHLFEENDMAWSEEMDELIASHGLTLR